MSDKFGSILFKPTCSICGRVIDGDVKYRSGVDYAMIVPSICPHCESPFEQIVMPNPTNGSIFHYNKSMYEPYFELKKGV